MDHARRLTWVLLPLVPTLVLCGCSARTAATRALAHALSNDQSLVFTGENDPDLVAGSFPMILKTYEVLLDQQPGNRELLVAAGKAYTLYAFAFVQSPADRMGDDRVEERSETYARARDLYERGRDYLFMALDRAHPGMRAKLLKGPIDSALTAVNAADTTALYWAGVAWMGHLTAGKAGLSAVFNLPRAAALLNKVVTFNDHYDRGAAHEALISYCGLVPPSMGGSEARAREHFEKAVAMADSSRARPYVSLAVSVALKNKDRTAFQALLERALAVDIHDRTPDRLANVVYQQNARALLARIDTLLPQTK